MVSLDVGCGFCFPHKKRGQIGIDRMKGKCDIQADAHILPFKDESFDKIFLMAILEHLTNPAHCLNEVKRVSKRNAKIYIEIPQITSMTKWMLKRSIADFPFGNIVALRWLIRNRKESEQIKELLGHKTIITPQSIANYFHVVSIQKVGNHSWFQGRKGKILKKLGIKDRTEMDLWQILVQKRV